MCRICNCVRLVNFFLVSQPSLIYIEQGWEKRNKNWGKLKFRKMLLRLVWCLFGRIKRFVRSVHLIDKGYGVHTLCYKSNRPLYIACPSVFTSQETRNLTSVTLIIIASVTLVFGQCDFLFDSSMLLYNVITKYLIPVQENKISPLWH